MKTTNSIFAGSDASLTEVNILPVGSHGAGSYSLPAGDLWTDYESVEVVTLRSDLVEPRNSSVVTKEEIALNPTGWLIGIYSTTGTTTRGATVTSTGVSSFTITEAGSIAVRQIKAYKKKYTTRNLSKVVSVNGGADIAINSRYEIDIATMLGSEYLNRDLIVEVQIYVSGTNYTGWGKVGEVRSYQPTTVTYVHGVSSAVRDDGVIEVYTGVDYLLVGGVPDVWGNSATITSAPCRIKVWKVDEYLPATRSSGDITTIWTGSAGNGVTVDWSTYVLSQFDNIQVRGLVDGQEVRAFMGKEGSSRLGISGNLTSADIYGYTIRFTSVTDTGLTTVVIVGTSLTSVTLTGIYGINYS